MRLKKFNENIDFDEEDFDEEEFPKVPMNFVKNVKMIDVDDWDKLISDTYGRPYSLQQQDGCKGRGIERITIPSDYNGDEYMHDNIPEVINGERRGVKFKVWLERDPKEPVDGRTDWTIGLFWDRNFYPDINTVANDLYEKGIIEAGSYVIDIDW